MIVKCIIYTLSIFSSMGVSGEHSNSVWHINSQISPQTGLLTLNLSVSTKSVCIAEERQPHKANCSAIDLWWVLWLGLILVGYPTVWQWSCLEKKLLNVFVWRLCKAICLATNKIVTHGPFMEEKLFYLCVLF